MQHYTNNGTHAHLRNKVVTVACSLLNEQKPVVIIWMLSPNVCLLDLRAQITQQSDLELQSFFLDLAHFIRCM